MRLAEDLDVFLQEFGVPATLGIVQTRVVFGAEGVAVLGGLVESTGPECLAKASDAEGLVKGASITIGPDDEMPATAYTLVGRMPDATGRMVVLQLREG